MSFGRQPFNDLTNQEYFANPEQAMWRALQQRGMSDRNWMARRMMDRSAELTPMAYAYGVDNTKFLDFVNQYTGSMLNRPGAGPDPFSGGAIAQRAQSFIDNPNQWNSAGLEYMTQGDPEEQFRRMMSFRALTQRSMLPGYRQADANVQQRGFRNWWNQIVEDPQGAAQTWYEAQTGRTLPVQQSPTMPGAPAPPPGGGMAAQTQQGQQARQPVKDQNQRQQIMASWGLSRPGHVGAPGTQGFTLPNGVVYNGAVDTARGGHGMSGWNHFLYMLDKAIAQGYTNRDEALAKAYEDLRRAWTTGRAPRDWSRSGWGAAPVANVSTMPWG